MTSLKRFVFSVCCSLCLFCGGVPAWAADLAGTASVNVTSDTATNAKNMAMVEARRQIIKDALSQYSIPEQLDDALQAAAGDDLMNLISTTSIGGEQLSDTTYSANISMTLDRRAALQWLTNNNVQNWLPDGTSDNKFIVLITLSDAVADWIELNRIARNEQIDLFTKYMLGNHITAELPSNQRGTFTIAVRESGWKYSDQDGILRLWK